MKLFVIGASGYIGRVLYDAAEKRFETYGTTTLGSQSDPKIIALSLINPESFDYLQISSDDVVLITAAISSPDVCAREHERAWSVNVTGTSQFIQSVIERKARVVFFSSDTVYGEHAAEFDEAAACNPAGEYAQMKWEVEHRFAGNPSFKAIRLSYVFSREDKFSRYLTECAERNEEADLFHPFFRAIVHRDDVVDGVLALAASWDEVPNQVINFGGPQMISRIDFAECLREVSFHKLRFTVTEPNADFFKNRPRAIAMASPVFADLLGRPPRTLCEAARLEFASLTKAERFL